MSTHTFSLCGIDRDNYWRKLDNLHFSVRVVDVTEQEAHVNAIFGMIRMLSASNLTLMVLLPGILNYCIAQVQYPYILAQLIDSHMLHTYHIPNDIPLTYG